MTTAFMIGVVGLHLEDLLFDGVILRVDKNELIYAAVIFPVTMGRLLCYMCKLSSLMTLRLWIWLKRIGVSISFCLLLIKIRNTWTHIFLNAILQFVERNNPDLVLIGTVC